MPNEANTPFSTLKVAEDVHLCAFELPTFSHFLHQVLVPSATMQPPGTKFWAAPESKAR